MMKLKSFLMTLVVSFIAACSPNSDLERTLTKSNWQVAWYGDIASPSPVADDSLIIVSFIGKQQKVNFVAGCNSIEGSYQLKGNSIALADIKLHKAEANCSDPNDQMQQISAILTFSNTIETLTGGDVLISDKKSGIKLVQSWQ